MATRLLDTNIISYLLKGHSLAGVYRPHLDGHTMAICFMSEAELYEGAYPGNWGPGEWPDSKVCSALSCTYRRVRN